MATRYDICTGRKDNEGKTRWTKIGAMFPAREGDGFSIKLDALPLTNEKGEVRLSAFVPKPRDDQQQRGGGRGSNAAPSNEDGYDPIPF